MDELQIHFEPELHIPIVNTSDVSVFKTAFDHSADGLLVLNANRQVLYMNQTAKAMVGSTDVLGAHCGTLLHCHDDSHDTLRFDSCYGQNVLATQKSLTHVEMNIVSTAGEIIPVEVTYSYIPGLDGSEYLLMSLRNVSIRKEMEKERRQKEALRYTLQERERLARDLHDGVVQDIAYANMQIKLMIEDLHAGRDPIVQDIEKVSGILEESFVELRRAIHDLTFSVQADLHTFVQQYLLDYQTRTGIEAHLDCNQTIDNVEPFMRSQIVKVIQEALANIRKHAQATMVHVRIRIRQKDTLFIAIEDNGQGFSPNHVQGEHYGLKTMRERCELMGGQFTVQSVPKIGTAIQMIIPLN